MPAHTSLRTLWLSLVGLLSLTALSEARAFSTVVIDPGHGGQDIGGNHGKVYEKHLALDTAMRLDYYLRQRGYKTHMTRKSDTFISLPKRTRIGNRFRNSIFVSIHYNYASRRGASGLETFYYTKRSKPLARYIHQGMMQKVRVTDRGVKFARYYVIRHTKNPSVLVEAGFVSNSRERSRTKKGWYRQAIAEGIGNGIMRYQRARRARRVR